MIQILVACLLALSTAPDVPADTPKLKSIFNGKNLKHWQVPEDNIWWSVRDGILHVENGPEKKGSILWTKKQYKDFMFECDFRMGKGIVDSGIFIRNDKEQIQIGISGSLKRDMTCSPYIVGKGYPVEAEGIPDLLKVDGWNTLRIQARGNHYTSGSMVPR